MIPIPRPIVKRSITSRHASAGIYRHGTGFIPNAPTPLVGHPSPTRDDVSRPPSWWCSRGRQRPDHVSIHTDATDMRTNPIPNRHIKTVNGSWSHHLLLLGQPLSDSHHRYRPKAAQR